MDGSSSAIHNFSLASKILAQQLNHIVMKFFQSSTRGQLLLGFGLVVILLLTVVAVGISGIHSVRESKRELHDRTLASVRLLNRFESNQNAARATVLMLILTDEERDRRLARVQTMTAESREFLERLPPLLDDLPRERATLGRIRLLHEEFVDVRDEQVIPVILRGDRETAIQLSGAGPQMERFRQIEELTRGLLNDLRAHAESVYRKSEDAARGAMALFIIIAVIAVVLAVVLAFSITSIITRPLTLLSGAAESIASGDLTVSVPASSRQDEIGILTASFHRMLNSLREFNGEIREGVNVLASSASEILAANAQIATGVAETAASVNETTSTLEESRQTARLVSQKAASVLEVSQKVARGSTDGRKRVDEAANEIQVIKEHMDNIAQNILRLHEHSQAIGDIISSVNDIAEQSNLLAVNAAIEAAKAGDEGRGFGVVAQEMKLLAGRSKQATGQVRSILGEIQQTANSTVMATERGNKVVETGVEKSRAAGEAIRAMAEIVAAASQAAMQISASSNEQLVGMEQVASAMANITQASQQNAAGTKQAEVSARNLHELGQRLKEMTARFRLSSEKEYNG
jgi:methyl-accepting chemotaxis protein